MTTVQNSSIIQFFAALLAFLRESWELSMLRRGLDRIERVLRNVVEGSALCQWLWADGILTKSWPGSFLRGLLMGILNLPVALVQWLYRKGKSLFDGSYLFRLVSAIGEAGCLFLGLGMLIMLVVPHQSWDNGYALRSMLAVLVLFLLGAAARRSRRLELDTVGPYYTLFLAFIVYAFLGSLATTFENGILHGLTSEAQNISLRFFIFHMISFLIVLLAVSTIHRPEDLRRMLVVAMVGLTAAALYGCYQGYVGVPVVAAQQDMVLNKGMPGRVFSVFDNPNNFAEILAMFIPFLLALFQNAKTWRGKLLAALAILPCVGSIAYTLSRSSWIGLALAVLIFIALLNWRVLPLFLMLGALAVPLLPASIMNRALTIGNMEDTSTLYRFAIWDATANLVRDHGLRGVGLGSDIMRKVFRTYPTMFDGNYPLHSHNNYLQMVGELGIFGAISYVALVLSQVKRGVKAFYAGENREVKRLLAAAIGAFCGILVIGLAEYTWYYPRNLFIWWFLFGVITACVKLLRGKSGQKGEAYGDTN